MPATPEVALKPRPHGVPLARWLYEELRRGILEGRLRSRARLPSTRDLARHHRVSRRTAVAAYERLRDEGYVTSLVGAGTIVNERLPDDLLRASARRTADRVTRPDVSALYRRPARPFRPIEPALAEFPAEIWARVAARRLRRLSTALLAGGSIAGSRPLREAVAEYLGASRGVNCSADQVVIVSGVQQGLDLIARLLLRPGDVVWIEDPAYTGAAQAFRTAGAVLTPVKVDAQGFDPVIARQMHPRPRAAYVTPAHQFVLGSTMPVERRLMLLAAARDADMYVIEDDYDSEFRFAGARVPALQGLDRWERVIFMGSFNKLLFPALRLGYIVVPDHLIDPLLRLRSHADRYPPAISQAVLCDFIVDGHFARHVRRMRELYAVRLDALHTSAARYLAGVLEIPSIDAGLHTPAFLTGRMTSADAHRRAAAYGIESIPLDRFALRRRDMRGLLLGFAAFTPREIHRAMGVLAQALG